MLRMIKRRAGTITGPHKFPFTLRLKRTETASDE